MIIINKDNILSNTQLKIIENNDNLYFIIMNE